MPSNDLPLPRWRERLEETLGAETSSHSLALLRIVVGLTTWHQFTSPWAAHRMDDLAGQLALAWVVLLGAWLLIAGLATRAVAASMAIAFAILHLYYGVAQGDEALARPVLEFQLLVLVALTPSGRSLSLDRWLELRRARAQDRPPALERARWWQLELFVVVGASVVVWLGLAHTDEAWLRGEVLLRDVAYLYGSDVLAASPGISKLCRVAAWLITITALVAGALMIPRRTRAYALWPALILLVLNNLVFAGSFALFYATLVKLVPLLACVPPARVEGLIRDQAPGTPAVEGVRAPAPSVVRNLVLPILALAAALAWANVPAYRGHIQGQARGLFAWTWSLVPQVKAEICEIRYYDLNRDGAPIERWTALGYERPGSEPNNLARVTRRSLPNDAVRVCQALRKTQAAPPRIEGELRCLVGDEWTVVVERGEQLCWDPPAKTE